MTAGDRAIPTLPCGDLDDIVRFYVALGFEVTYRQQRPNPYLVVQRGGIDLHFFGLADYKPEESMGSAILVVADTGRLFDEFAEGLRSHFGKLPITGIPRITRPRRKQGMSAGFTVVDPGGNWLRVTGRAEAENEHPTTAGVLDRVLLNATRQGDSHGDVPTAISVIQTGLLRHPEASAIERLPVLAYLAELQVRNGNITEAKSTLVAVAALDLSEADRTRAADDLRAAEELRHSLD
jgi:catechol 2,3-dioxygenase-like lactoylglutathione lyase family enzyme